MFQKKLCCFFRVISTLFGKLELPVNTNGVINSEDLKMSIEDP